MRIAVPVLTRNRPLGLACVLRALDSLATGRNEIEYIVRYDDDDPDTERMLIEIEREQTITRVCFPRPITLGHAWNEAARCAKPWDICMELVDDVIPLTQGWDEGLRELMESRKLPAVSWYDVNDQTNTDFPVIARPWYDAVGRIAPEWFPFWFNDTWLAEVHYLAFGTRMPIVSNLIMGGRKGKVTGNMREVGFWFELFAKSRTVRVAEAEKVAAAFGKPFKNPEHTLRELDMWDRYQMERHELYQSTWGDPNQPSERYLEAKAAAVEWMNQRSPEGPTRMSD